MTAYVPGTTETHLPKIVRSLQQLAAGRSNGVGTVTLTVSATSTTVVDDNCAAGAAILLMPTTADAAAALSTTYIPTTAVKNKGFTITHVSATSADRTFVYAIHG